MSRCELTAHLLWGGGKTALQNNCGSVNKPHSHTVPPLCEEKREPGSLTGGSVRGRGGCPGSRLRASLAVGPSAPQCPQPPPGTACSLLPGFGASANIFS